MTDNSPVAKLRRAALNLLARRDYSRYEMANKLRLKASKLQADVAEQKSPKNPRNNPAKQRQYDELGFDDDNLEADLGIQIDTSVGVNTDRRAVISAAANNRTDTDKKLSEEQDVEAGNDECVDISAEVEPVLNWLTELNFLNDHRFVEAYIRYGIGRGHGLMRIRQDLQRKGIEKTLLADALDSLETDWFELAADLRQRRFGASPPKSEQKERARQMRFLQYRGFSLDQCFYALSRESGDD